MGDAFYRDSFSYPFNVSSYFGNWPFDLNTPLKKKLFTFYRVIAAIYEWQLVIIGWIDLYLNLYSFQRVVYNLSVTLFTTTIILKNIHIILKAHRVNEFRQKLFLHTLSQDEEDTEIMNRYRHFLKICRIIFYSALVLFAPFWLSNSLLSLKQGPRELPFPVWLPLDLEDNFQFGFGFVYHTLGASFFLLRTMHVELAMYSIMLQITGLYEILGKDLSKINDFYTDDGGRKKEINKFLIRSGVKKELKSFWRRQMELKEYVKEIENILYLPVLLEVFGGLVLSVMNGYELIESTMVFSFKLTYQIAYTIIILTALFVWCLFSDLLMESSKNISNRLYNLAWYEMETNIQKDIVLMILEAQRIQRLTVGKLFTLDLSTYLGIIKNLYTCLTVFRTVTQKNKDLNE